MSSYKKIDLQRDFAAGVYLSEAQNPILRTREKVTGVTVHKVGTKIPT
jgi:hypothetical protein